MMMGAWHRANLADDRADAAADERAECAQLLRLSNRELLLLAGEMTAQELRTVQAVLTNRAAVIMERPNAEFRRGEALACNAGLAGREDAK